MKFINQCIVAALLLIPFASSGQVTYQKTYGEEGFTVFTDVCASSNDELVTTGYWTPTVATRPVQPLLTRVDNSGNVMWSKEYASTGVGRAASVTNTSDGGFLAAGKVDTIVGVGGSDDGYVLKVDENGAVEWMTIVGSGEDEEFTRVYESQLGDIIAVGTSSIQATGDEYFWFVKMNSNGTVINSFVYFPTANAQAQTLAFHPDGGYIIGGIGRVNFIDEAYLFKISSTGVLEWYKSYGTFGGSESINDIVRLSDNSIVFVGTRLQANSDIFLAKTDSIGQLLWIKNFGGPNHDEAFRLLEHSSGGFVVSGATEGLDGSMGPILFKTNAAGDLEWTHFIGEGMPTGTVGMVQLSTGMLALAGTIMPDQGTAIGLISKVNSAGVGCNSSIVALPVITATTSGDTPVVYATLGPSSVVSYNPTISDVTHVDSTACSTASINEQFGENLIELYPNPINSGSEFWISTSNFTNDQMEIEILDYTGRSVFTKRGLKNKLNISTIGWSKGVYLVSIKVGQLVEIKRIVVR